MCIRDRHGGVKTHQTLPKDAEALAEVLSKQKTRRDRLQEAERTEGNIVGVKDSTGDMTNCEEYLRLTMDQRDRFSVIMGRDTMIYAGLHYGCAGAVASCANVAPRLVADIYDKFVDGDPERFSVSRNYQKL